MAFLFFIILILSIFTIVKPEVAWYLSTGWKLRDAEPSDLALAVNRVSGVVLSIISVIVIINNITDSSAANNWPKNFVNQLSVETVEKIELRFDKVIPKEEIGNVVEIIRDVDFRKIDRQYSYVCSYTIEITFIYGERETIYCMGDRFWLSPRGLDYDYEFRSSELKKLLDKLI